MLGNVRWRTCFPHLHPRRSALDPERGAASEPFDAADQLRREIILRGEARLPPRADSYQRSSGRGPSPGSIPAQAAPAMSGAHTGAPIEPCDENVAPIGGRCAALRRSMPPYERRRGLRGCPKSALSVLSCLAGRRDAEIIKRP